MKIISEITYGSHLYGTNIETSDVDVKGVWFPNAKDIILQKIKGAEKVSGSVFGVDDLDAEIFSMNNYLKMVSDGQSMALEMLFAPLSMHRRPPDKIWLKIIENKDKLVTSKMDIYIRYAEQQAALYAAKGERIQSLQNVIAAIDSKINKFGHKEKAELVFDDLKKIRENELRTFGKSQIEFMFISNGYKEIEHACISDKKTPATITLGESKALYEKRLKEYGQRAMNANNTERKEWKSMAHAVRLSFEALELLETGNIIFPLVSADYLKNIRLGKVEYNEVIDIIEQSKEKILIAKEKTKLRNEADMKWINDFIYNSYVSQIVEELDLNNDLSLKF